MRGNNIRGPLDAPMLPLVKNLRTLNLDRNVIGSIRTATFSNFTSLVLLSLRQCQIDVLEDRAFDGLNSLQELDLGYNGIVSISSLINLPKLVVLNLKHNFLRAVSADMISPLSLIQQLDLSDNDITTVHPNALRNVTTLKNLSLLNNPLDCDCNLRNLREFSTPSKSLYGAVCQTPPRLEGAPLLQIPPEALTCDDQGLPDTANSIANQMNNTFLNYNQNFPIIEDASDDIKLEEFHLSIDYGLLMMWNIANPLKRYKCNTLFVFEQIEGRNVVRNSSPVNCENSRSSRANSFTILIPEGFDFTRGELYKFCLTLNNFETPNINDELLFGCSEYIDVSKDLKVSHNTINTSTRLLPEKLPLEAIVSNSTDISTFDKISENPRQKVQASPKIQELSSDNDDDDEEQLDEIIDDDLKTRRRVLIALGAIILFASVCIFIIAVVKMYAQQRRRRISADICHSIDSEYVKLETTTTL